MDSFSPDQCSAPMETSVIESDTSTSQLCDWPAVIGNNISTVVAVSDFRDFREPENTLTGGHTDSRLVENNNAVEKAYSMSCKVQMCIESSATTVCVCMCVCVCVCVCVQN